MILILGFAAIIYTSPRTLLSLLPSMNVTLGHSPPFVHRPQSLPPFSDKSTAFSTPLAAEGKYHWHTNRFNAVAELPEVIILSSLIVLLKLIYGTTENDEFVSYVSAQLFPCSN